MSTSRLPCLECKDRASVRIFKDGSYCYACHKQDKYKSLFNDKVRDTGLLLNDFNKTIPKIGLDWLKKYYITDRQIKDFMISWSEKYQRLVFPYYNYDKLIFSWLRDPTGLRQPKWLFNGDKTVKPYYFELPHRGHKRLIITEDVVSAIRCSPNDDILALGGLNYKDYKLIDIFLKYPQLVVWLDGDKAGRDAAMGFKKRYHVTRPVRIIRTKADPKTYSNFEIQEILK